MYLYRAVDSTGDFLLSAKRDAAAAERFLAKALGGENHPAPRIINTDEHAGYPPAIVQLTVATLPCKLATLPVRIVEQFRISNTLVLVDLHLGMIDSAANTVS